MTNIVGQAVPVNLIFGRDVMPITAHAEKEEVVKGTTVSPSTDHEALNEALNEALKTPVRSVHGYTVSLNI